MPTPASSTIHQSISDDGVIEIVQQHSNRSLYFGSSAKQSEMDISQPERLVLSYTQAMMAGLLFCPAPRSVLLIGLGGGSLVRFLLHHFPACHIDVVEFRADVVKLAYGYFYLPDDNRLDIIIDDGFDFLAANRSADKRYDLILVDAFDHDGIATSIKSSPFFDACRASLNDQGVTAINLWNSQRDQFAATMANLESAFHDCVLELPVKDKGNVIAFATPSKERCPSFKTLKPIAEMLEQQLELPFGTYLRELRRHNRWRMLAKYF
jgi:spermidine synthase